MLAQIVKHSADPDVQVDEDADYAERYEDWQAYDVKGIEGHEDQDSLNVCIRIHAPSIEAIVIVENVRLNGLPSQRTNASSVNSGTDHAVSHAAAKESCVRASR